MGMRRTLGRFGRDRRASAAVEFVFIVPVFLVLQFSSQQLALASGFKTRLEACTTAMSDLVGQLTSDEMKKANVVGILDIRRPMLNPFNDSRLGTRLTAIAVDAAGKATVIWSFSSSTSKLTPLGKKSTVALPKDLVDTGESTIVMAEGSYAFPSVFGSFGVPGLFELTSTSYARARSNQLPDCKDC